MLCTHTGKCSNPTQLVHRIVKVDGFEDPALEGEIIEFTCRSSGFDLSGPYSSTCMSNGKWDPDPGEVNCTGPGKNCE